MTKTLAGVWALLLCLAALPLMIGLTGCTGNRHPQSTDQHIADSRTAERVREALASAPGYKFDGVRVTAFNGVVQLRGFVNTRAQVNAGANIAGRVQGVSSVENNLTLKD